MGSLAGLALVPLGQIYVGFGALGTALALGALWVGVRARDWPTVRVAVVTILILLTGLTGLPFGIWLVIGLMWLVSLRVSFLQPNGGWLPPGHGTPAAWVLTGVVVVLAGVGLTIWALTTEQFGESTAELVEVARGLSPPVLVLAVLVFVTFNAVTEELAYRGIAFEAAAGVFSPGLAVLIQALAFGALHVAGFPAGSVGVGLAFGYGLVLGVIRLITAGLRIPIVAHVAADATIALLVIGLLVPVR